METFIKIATTVTPIITIIISSIISFLVARHQTKNEIKKLIMSYNREDKQLLNDAFTELMTKTQEYCDFQCGMNLHDAISANSKFLTIAPKLFHPLLKELDVALQNADLHKIKTIRKSLMDLFSNNN